MATVIALRAASPAAASKAAPAAKVLPFAKGKGAEARNVAFGDVEVLGYIEGKSRGEVVASLRLALGKAPTPAQVAACRDAYIIGRVAGRLLIDGDVNARLANARDVVLRYASPAKDGVAARKLRKGQLGRRTVEQHKAVRAAEEAWSQMKAEVAPEQSNAKTQAAKNAAKRAPAMAGSTARGTKGTSQGAGAGITHSELVKPDGKPVTAGDAVAYAVSMASTLLMFANKHAGVMPTDMGAAIKAFHAAAQAAGKAHDASQGVEA